MYGYEPPRQQDQPGGCRDSLLILRVAFEVLTPIALVGIGAMGLIALTFVLFATHVLLGLIPVAMVVVAYLLLIRRDRRLQRERDEQVGGPPRGTPP